MSELVKLTQQLPEAPTAADTADWYRLGDAVEKHGRHMKRQAVAAEYNSGRNMEAWYREIGLPIGTGKELVGEAKSFGMLQGSDTSDCASSEQLSQALPTARAAREYAKAEPEVKEIIKEIIREDPEAEIKAAQIRELREERERLLNDALMGRRLMSENEELKAQLNALTDNEATQLQEAKRELDMFGQSIMALAREVDGLSANAFTYNDPTYIEQLHHHICTVAEAFQRRILVSDESAIVDCTVTGVGVS